MTKMFDQAVECGANWKGPELARSDSWIHTLTADELTELDGALAHVKARGVEIPNITRDDFPLPTLASVLAGFLNEIEK